MKLLLLEYSYKKIRELVALRFHTNITNIKIELGNSVIINFWYYY